MTGSGVYKFVNWQRGERLNLEVNEDYWGEKAKLDLRWVNVQDTNVMTLGLRAGDYDMIEGVPSIIGDLEGAPGITLKTDTPGLQLLQIGFNQRYQEEDLPEGDTVPEDFFHDVRVRQAFNYTFDYQAEIDGALFGAATRGSYVLPEGLYGYDPDAPIYEYNPERAEELFKEAGWWDKGFTVSIISDESPTFTDPALILKDGIESLNPKFRINVQSLAEARFDGLMAQDPIPAAMWSFTSPEFRDPDAYMVDLADPDGRWGTLAGFENGYSDPDAIAEMITEAKRELDPDARADLYSELQEVLYEEAMWIFTAQEAAVAAYQNGLTGVTVNPMWPRPALRYSLYGKGGDS